MAKSHEFDILLKARDEATQTIAAFSGTLGGLITQFGKIGVAGGALFVGFDTLRGAIASAKELLAESVREALASEDAYNRLGSAVELAGKNYGTLQSGLEETLVAIQKTTRFSDEEAAEALQRLITFTGDYDSALKALPVTLDLAARLHLDLETAAKVVGVAIEGNTTSLARYGIRLDDATKQAIAFADQEARTSIVIDALSAKVRGSAVRDAETLSGALVILGHQADEVKEAIGRFILAFADDEVLKALANTLGDIALAIDAVRKAVPKEAFRVALEVTGLAELKTVLTIIRELANATQSAAVNVQGATGMIASAFGDLEGTIRKAITPPSPKPFEDFIRIIEAETDRAAAAVDASLSALKSTGVKLPSEEIKKQEERILALYNAVRLGAISQAFYNEELIKAHEAIERITEGAEKAVKGIQSFVPASELLTSALDLGPFDEALVTAEDDLAGFRAELALMTGGLPETSHAVDELTNSIAAASNTITNGELLEWMQEFGRQAQSQVPDVNALVALIGELNIAIGDGAGPIAETAIGLRDVAEAYLVMAENAAIARDVTQAVAADISAAFAELVSSIIKGHVDAGQILKQLAIAIVQSILKILINAAVTKAIVQNAELAASAARSAASTGVAFTEAYAKQFAFYSETGPFAVALAAAAVAAGIAGSVTAGQTGAAAVGAANAGLAAGGSAAGGLARGGIVAGSESGDRQPFLLESGEGVLSRATAALIFGGRAALVPPQALGAGGGGAGVRGLMEASETLHKAAASLAGVASDLTVIVKPEVSGPRTANLSVVFERAETQATEPEEILKQINRLVEKSGYTLTATRLSSARR